jgi:hypothetical protein
LENGDYKLAHAEKLRLEEKQRTVRKYKEKNKIEHKTAYFEPYVNDDDGGIIDYYYTGEYFEKDRKEKDWSRLPDIYGTDLPSEIEEFIKSK